MNKQPHRIDLPCVEHVLGNLFFCQKEMPLPFEVKRVYFVEGIPAGARRGGHSHKEGVELFIVISGGVTVRLLDPTGREMLFHLNSPREGLLIPPDWWVDLRSYQAGTVTLVLSSVEFLEDNYIREPEDFFTAAIPDDVISRSTI